MLRQRRDRVGSAQTHGAAVENDIDYRVEAQLKQDSLCTRPVEDLKRSAVLAGSSDTGLDGYPAVLGDVNVGDAGVGESQVPPAVCAQAQRFGG